MVLPSGEQYEITAGSYRAVITESGAALRTLAHDDRELVDGFAEHEASWSGRGQVLMPWPNRIRDGRYSFAGKQRQLGLTEPARNNASHGLVRWAAWTVEEHTEHSVSMVYRLMAQSGYPWTIDLHLLYDVSADGLAVTHTATNLADSPAPYGAGMHPYLTVENTNLDQLELILPAATRTLVDDRLIPVGTEPVDGTGFDFRVARPLAGTTLDDGFTDLARDDEGRAHTVLRRPGGAGAGLWVDGSHRWLQVFTADAPEAGGRRSLAVEPMTCPADAFNSGRDLITLAPSGEPGDEFSASWGIYSV